MFFSHPGVHADRAVPPPHVSRHVVHPRVNWHPFPTPCCRQPFFMPLKAEMVFGLTNDLTSRTTQAADLHLSVC